MSSPRTRNPSPTGTVRERLGAHLSTLDGVRGLAILLVLAHNFNVIAGPQSAPGHALDLLGDLGWVGVQLFFVLSGFLITGILLDTKASPNYYGSFFGRRLLRIFPLYYAVLAVTFLILPLVTTHHPDGSHQFWLWTYTSNWAAPTGREVAAFPHFWSLAVEEQFYLVWPFVVRALAPRHLASLCVGLMIAALGIRFGMRYGGGDPEPVYMWTICRMDALAAGALVACLLRLPRGAQLIRRWRWQLGWGALFVALAGFVITRGDPRTTGRSQTLGYSILAVTFAVFVFAAVLADARSRSFLKSLLNLRPLRTLGTYSYGIYVFHVPLHLFLGLRLMDRYGPADGRVGAKLGLAYFVVATLATLAIAMVSYHLFERPFLKLKDRFAARRTPTTIVAATPPITPSGS